MFLIKLLAMIVLTMLLIAAGISVGLIIIFLTFKIKEIIEYHTRD